MKIAVILGSDSDLKIAEKGLKILNEFQLDYEVRILSAHRTPAELHEYVESFPEIGVEAVIAVAGKAAHLPGVIASLTLKPVIGLPIDGGMDGMDALLSIVQMPKGIPVATVGVNNAQNAALLAVHILALKDEKLTKKLKKYREEQREIVLEKDKKTREAYR
jgi:5-(carboxyamino)imidazole ribonucleotide mutase